MSFTTQANVNAGDVLTAAYLNTNRDNVQWVATDSPSCRAFNSATVSITNGVSTVIPLNSERFDNASMHDVVTNTSRITIPTGGSGKYVLGASLDYVNGGGNFRSCHVKQNGATLLVGHQQPPCVVGNASISVASVYALSAADYIETYGNQDSGGALNVAVSANYSPEFWAFWFRN